MRYEDHQGQPFDVRAYAPSDRRGLEVMYAAFEPRRRAQGLPPGDAIGISRWLNRILPQGEHLVATIDGRIIGHAMLIPMEHDTLELANFVHQSARNRGIGTMLNKLAVARAEELGARRVWLSVEPSNRAALKSYERAGFRPLPGMLWGQELEMTVDLSSAQTGASPT